MGRIAKMRPLLFGSASSQSDRISFAQSSARKFSPGGPGRGWRVPSSGPRQGAALGALIGHFVKTEQWATIQ